MSKQSAQPKYTPSGIWPIFERYLSQEMVASYLARTVQRFYQRIFSPWIVIWGFLFQRLNGDHTCDAFVSHLSSDPSGRWHKQGKPMGESNAGYCQARQRLPSGLARHVFHEIAQRIAAEAAEDGLWQNRMVYLLDGSTLRLPASAELVNYYGCPSGGAVRSHWPVMRIMAAFHLWSGAVREVIEAPQAASEYDMAVQLFRRMPSGIVWVGDRMFSIYRMLQVLVHCQQDAVIRMQAKNVGQWSRHGTLSSHSDLDVVWSPSAADHPEMGTPIVAIAGRFICMRIETDGFRPLPIYLFTTLTDRQRYPLAAIVRLYARRWGVELDLRHVKTTLAMEELDGKSLDIVRKELWLGLTAYNLIRVLMHTAATRAGCAPLMLSFAQCWRRIQDTARSLSDGKGFSAYQLELCLDRLWAALARCRLPIRTAARVEPRAVWGKPRPFPFLRGSRQAARLALIADRLNS